MKRVARVVVLGLLVAACAGTETTTTTEPRPVVTGELVFLEDTRIASSGYTAMRGRTLKEGEACIAAGADGSRIIVEDGDGSIIGTATAATPAGLRLNSFWDEHVIPKDMDVFDIQGRIDALSDCAYPFTSQLSRQAGFYRFRVEGKEGDLVLSHSEIETLGWFVVMTTR